MARCRRYIEERGWRQPDEEHVFIDEAISGSTAVRPGYQAMLAGVEAQAFDVLVVDDASRLSRDNEDTAALMKRLAFYGVGLVAISDGVDTIANLKSAALIMGVKAALNEEFLRDLAEKTRRGLSGQVERGFSPGGLPYGYRSRPVYSDPPRLDRYGQPIPVGYRREVVPEEAEVVMRIFRLYADGMSARGICNILNSEGIPPPGRRWRNRSKIACEKWSYTAIQGDRRRGTGILNNELYQGVQVWNRSHWRKHPTTRKRLPRQRPEAEWQRGEVPHLRIVDAPLWQRVKARQAKTGVEAPLHQRAAMDHHNRYLLSGLLQCGYCGARLIRIGASGYGCATRWNRGRDQCQFQGTPNRLALEAGVLEAVRKHLFTEENLSEVIRCARQGLKARAAEARANAGRRETGGRRLKELEREIGNVLAAVRAGGDDGGAALLRRELDRLIAEQERLAAQVGDPGDGRAVEEALERALAQVPQAVEEYLGKGDLAELTDSHHVARAREVLARIIHES
jgi:DNA invertase Pin-like site-specific DNA recombinase